MIFTPGCLICYWESGVGKFLIFVSIFVWNYNRKSPEDPLIQSRRDFFKWISILVLIVLCIYLLAHAKFIGLHHFFFQGVWVPFSEILE